MSRFLLLHGSWHGAWCWHKVAARLRSAGHEVCVPDLPAHGRAWRWPRGAVALGAMTSAAVRALEASPEPTFVVAHSRAGIVASQLAEARPDRVRASIYLASYMLRSGERVLDFFARDRESLVGPSLVVDRLALTDWLLPRAHREALYADCEDDDVELSSSLLVPEPSLPALTRLSLSDARYGRVPRHYIELTEDRAVSPALQRALHGAQACASVVRIAASHSAYYSRPDELTSAIVECAGMRATPRAA